MHLEAVGEKQTNKWKERRKIEELLDMISAVKCHISILPWVIGLLGME